MYPQAHELQVAPPPNELPEPISRQRSTSVATPGRSNPIDRATTAYLTVIGAATFGSDYPMQAYEAHLAKIMTECGEPSDPIARILIAQIVMANHQIGRLHVSMSKAESAESIEAYCGALTKLLSELRRCTLALRDYSDPTNAKSVTYVKQQNLAQSQQVAYVERSKKREGVASERKKSK